MFLSTETSQFLLLIITIIPKWLNFSILLFAFQLALFASFKVKFSFNLKDGFKYQKILKWWPFWNKVCSFSFRLKETMWACFPERLVAPEVFLVYVKMPWLR